MTDTELLKLRIQHAIATRDFKCNGTSQLGVLNGAIIIMPLNWTCREWAPCCKLSKSQMDQGMTVKEWDSITKQLSLLIEGLAR